MLHVTDISWRRINHPSEALNIGETIQVQVVMFDKEENHSDEKPDEINEVQEELIKTVKKVSGDNWVVGSVERQKFYVEAKKAMAVITTSDTRPYGCFMFTKGVLKPDGTVWIV